MALNATQVSRLYKDRGPVGFVREMHQMLGLRNPDGVRNRNQDGRLVLESQKIKPETVSLRGLAIGLLGEQSLEESLRTPAPQVMEFQRDVLEAGNEVVPSQFSNITAYNETVAGLLEAKILEAYQRPEFIADKLVTNYPSNKVQEKFIGISTPGDDAQQRQPGQPHPRTNLSERYVVTPVTKNYANAIDVTAEAALFDMTRQLMDHADQVGQTLALRKEYRVLNTFLGIDNTYSYNGTTYNTYLLAADNGNWANWVVEELVDWTDFDVIFKMFTLMTDQETGLPISVDAKDLMVMPAKLATAMKIIHDTTIQARTPTTMAVVSEGSNPMNRWGFNDPLYSVHARRAGLAGFVDTTDATAYTAAEVDEVWYAGNFKKAFGYVENIPLKVQRAAPSSYEMLDRGLIFSLFADEMGVPFVREPRFVIRAQKRITT